MWIFITCLLICCCLSVGVSCWLVRRADAAYPPTGQFIQVDGVRYHYRMAGEGMPVVLLHGSGASFEDYGYGVFDGLTRDFKVIAIDRPGHGYSGRPKGDVGAPASQARIIRDVLHALAIDAAIVVGHSWSGALALAHAMQYPAHTSGLVLLQPTVYPQKKAPSMMIKALATPGLGFCLSYLMIPWAGRGAIRKTLQRAFAPDPIPSGYLERAQSMWTRPGQARALAVDHVRRAATIEALGEHYHELTLPVSLVAGAADSFIDPAGQVVRLSTMLADATIHTLGQAGHQIPQAHAEAVLHAIRELAARIANPRRGQPT